MKKIFSTVDRYLIREFLLALGISFFFFFFIFIVNIFLIMAEQILEKQVPLFTVLQLVFYQLPTVIAFSLPFSALVGCLMAVSYLNNQNELLALLASGISYLRIFLPILFTAIVLTLLSFIVNDVLLPVGNIKSNEIYLEIIYSSPELELDSYSVRRYQDSSIVTGRVSGNTIDSLVIFDFDAQKNKRVIIANTGELVKNLDEKNIITLALDDSFVFSPHDKKPADYDYFRAERMEYNILLSQLSYGLGSLDATKKSSVDVYKDIVRRRQDFQRRIYQHDLALAAAESQLFYAYVHNVFLLDQTSKANFLNTMSRAEISLTNLENRVIRDRQLNIYLIEFNRKFAIPASCFFFVILAFPLGIFNVRSGKFFGFVIGLIICFFYWAMLTGGWYLGLDQKVPPIIAMWFPNLFVFIFGIGFFIKRLQQ